MFSLIPHNKFQQIAEKIQKEVKEELIILLMKAFLRIQQLLRLISVHFA